MRLNILQFQSVIIVQIAPAPPTPVLKGGSKFWLPPPSAGAGLLKRGAGTFPI